MKKQLLGACLGALFFCSQAGAVSWTTSQTETTAISVTADGAAGYDDHTGTADDTLTASSASIGSTDVATAGAFYGAGLLTTSADVSANAIGSSTSTASFMGTFTSGNWVSLSLDTLFQNSASGSGEGSTTLFVSVVNNGVTLFSDYVDGPWQFTFSPTAGTTSEFDLTLTSAVDAGFLASAAGDASSFGQVTFSAAVPEAPTWLLLSLGAGVLAATRRRTRREAVPA